MLAKLLIVDDEAQFIEMIQIRLEASGYEVVNAANGEEGLEKAKAENPDLIILDLMMPVMDGFTMLKELREDEQIKDIPVLLCSAKSHLDGKNICYETNANDYIKKPFETADFLAKIENLLNKPS